MTKKIIGSAFYHTKCSENSIQWAKDNLASAPDGAIFIADSLTAARGRQGRTWQWAPGQIAVTILLKPLLFESLAHLSMALSLGIVTPLNKYGASLKWPNDFYLAGKKIGGMLMEIVWQDEKPVAAILGFALNVNNHFDTNHPLRSIATSLHDHLRTNIDSEELLTNLLANLDTWYHAWLAKENELIFASWKKQQLFLGKNVNVHYQNGSTISGILQNIAPNGDAILEHNGTSIIISFYEILIIT